MYFVLKPSPYTIRLVLNIFKQCIDKIQCTYNLTDPRCSRRKCMCRQSVLLSLLLLLFLSDFLCKYTANYCHYYHYYFCVKLRRQPRTCHIVVSRHTCALKTRRHAVRLLQIMISTMMLTTMMMMIGCKAKAFVAVLSTEVLVIGKTTFTELRMLRAMTSFWPQISFMSIYGFCRTLPKDVRQIRQLRNFFTLEDLLEYPERSQYPEYPEYPEHPVSL